MAPQAAAIDKAEVFAHPHHGVATVEGRSTRVIGGSEARVVTLVSRESSGILAVSGLSGAGFLSAREIRVSVPEELLESGKSAWSTCDNFRVTDFLESVESRVVDPWFSKVDTPIPTKMMDRCRSYLSHEVADSGYSSGDCAELVSQIADYLNVWHEAILTSGDGESSAKQTAYDSLLLSLGSTEEFWMSQIGRTYTVKANGREMLVVLGQIMGLVSSIGDMSEKESALLMDRAISNRLRGNHKVIKKRAKAARS